MILPLGKQTLAAWSKKWLETVRPTLKPATAAGYESLLRSRILPALGDYAIADLRASDVQGFVGSMQRDGLSASRIRHSLVVVRSMLDAAVRDRMLAVNPCHGVKAPKLHRREAPYFEPAVVDRIVAATPAPYDFLVRVLGVGGLRFGEAVALRRSSVDLMRRRLLIEESLAEVGGRFVFGPPKSHAVRAVPLSESFAAAFESYLEAHVAPEADALVFTGPKGGPLRYRYAHGSLWRPTLAALGLPAVGLHALRHSAGARMSSAGATPKAI